MRMCLKNSIPFALKKDLIRKRLQKLCLMHGLFSVIRKESVREIYA
nr:MAG TPA: hypothetical protein [Caudoviricetes sp.]